MQAYKDFCTSTKKYGLINQKIVYFLCILIHIFLFICVATEYPVRLRGYERVYGWYPGGYDHKWNHKCHRHHRTGYHNHHDGYKHELGGRSGGRGRRGCKWPGGRGVTKAVSKRGATKKNP